MSKPKVLGYVALHYGQEYLPAAIEAIYPHVDKIIVLYSEKPSYGFGTHTPCPESRNDLLWEVTKYSKVEWVEVNPCHEGNHRAQIFQYAAGYDGLLVFDADEVFDTDDLGRMIEYCDGALSYRFGIDGYINFWKSFNHACYDGFRPIRYFNLRNPDVKGSQEDVKCRIYHFGCAQRMPIMEYKLLIHGHKDEIRKGWLKDVYEAWTPGMEVENGLHLVAHNIWNAEPFDKTTLPEILKHHPNYDKEVII